MGDGCWVGDGGRGRGVVVLGGCCEGEAEEGEDEREGLHGAPRDDHVA